MALANKAMENKIRGAFSRAVPGFPEELLDKCSEQEQKSIDITKQRKSRNYFKLAAVAAALIVVFTVGVTGAAMGDLNYETLYYTYPSNLYYKNGMFNYTGSPAVMKFFDFDTMTEVPICPRPNCTHTDPNTCSAFGISFDYFIYNDKLWWFEDGTDDLGLRYDENGEFIDSSALYSANLDGTNRKKIAVLDGFEAMSTIYVKNGKAYFMAADNRWDMNWETGRFATAGYDRVCLYSYDFKKKEFTQIYPENDNGEHISFITIFGRYDNSLVLRVSEKSWYDAEEDVVVLPPDKYLFYDFSTGKFTECDNNIYRAQKDWLISKEDDGTIVVNRAYSGEEYRITDERFTQAFWGGYCVFDGMLFVSDGYAYELETGKVHTTQVCNIWAYYKGKYIVNLMNSAEYVSLTKKELLLD